MSEAARPLSSFPDPPLTFNAWLRWDLIRRALRHIRGDLLEIGCGGGAVGARLAQRFNYVGYEPDTVSAERAAQRLGGRGKVINDVLPDAPIHAYDVVCAFEVLEHIEHDAAALESWTHWLRPGGLLILSVPARPGHFGAADRAVGHFRRYEHTGMRALLHSVGLRDVDVRSYGFPLGYALEFGRNLLTRRREDAPITERTAASGRLFQPDDRTGLAVNLATWPFRHMQRVFEKTEIGTGIVAWARKPA